MTVDFRLAPQPVNYLEPLQAMALGQQAARQRAADARAEQDRQRQDQTRATVTTRLGAKDYAGAETAALSGGDTELAGHIATLDNAARARVADGFNTIGSLAYSLKQVPLEERAARFQAALPLLRAHGLSDEILQHADLSDAGLDGYINASLSVKDQMEAHKPTPVGEGALLVDPVTGRHIADNPKPIDYQHVTLTRGDQGQDGYTFNPRTGQWTADGGATTPGVPGAPSGGGPAPTAVVGGKLDPHAFFRDFVGPHEGGLNPHDANGAPTNHGINATANPGVDIQHLSMDGAANIFADKYFKASGAENLPPALAAVHADTYFINPKRAEQILQQSGGDPSHYMTLREKWLTGLVHSDPAKYGPYEKAWANRNRDLRQYAYQAGGGDTAASTPSVSPSGGAPHPAVSTAGKPDEPPLTGKALDRAATIYNQFGTLPPNMGRGGQASRAIINRAADMASGDPAAQAGGWYGAKADAASLRTLQTQADRVNASEKTAVANGHLALSLAPGANVGNTPLFNRWVNAGRKGVAGDPALTRFDASVQTFANEYANVVSVGSGNAVTSDTARQHAYEMINSAMAPKQFQAVMETLFREMGNRSQAVRDQLGEIRGRLQHAQGAPEPPHGGHGLPTLTPEQYRDAPSGTRFLTSAGRPMRKP